MRFRRLIAGAAVVLGLMGAGAVASAGSAGATPINPGYGMACTSGTDNCGGWVASNYDINCVAYNINWSHIWTGSPVGYADWHVVIDQWWNGGALCTAGGGAHLIGNVADIYVQDWEVPYVRWDSGPQQAFLYFHAHSITNYVGTNNVTAWTPCSNAFGGGVFDAADAYISGAGYSALTYQSGGYAITPAGTDYYTGACNLGTPGGMSVNGLWIAWYHYNTTVNGASYTVTDLILR